MYSVCYILYNVSHAVAPPLTPDLFTLSAMTLKFDHRCGRSVEVSEGGLVVEARNNW